jgi:hypothetical protein
LKEVALADVIDHAGSGWNSSSSIRNGVRSACCIRPRTGKRTSAISTAKTASTVDLRWAPANTLESPRISGREKTGKEDTRE